MECHVEPTRFLCQSPCKKTFACGHKCPDKCYEFCRSCLVLVDKTLPKCGHQQKIECHINPMLLKCKAVCGKQLSCGHQCKGICSQECPDCKVLVNKKLGCGHDQRLRCSRDVNNVKCLSRCEKTLSCGHQCKEECWNDVCTTVCLIKVKVNLSCGHEDDVSCIASSNRSKILCKKLCGKTLGCGHKCEWFCLDCLQGRFHMKCQMKCSKKLDCGHTCNGLCSMECPPCTQNCDNSCKHRKCSKLCGRPCTKCRSLCTWSCPHLKCTKLCGEACDRSPCNEHCTKILKCGHSCIGLCGEPCPKLCRVCDKQDVEKSLTGDESLATARFVELPKCGHIFTHTLLDKLMGVKDVVKSSEQTVKHCPQCKTPILQCVRYGQLLSQTWRDRVLVKPMQKPSSYTVKNVKVKYNKTFVTTPDSSELNQAAFHLYQKISKKQTKQQLNFKLMKLNYIYRLLEIQTRIKKMLGGKNTQNDALERTKEIADTVDFLGRRLLAENDGYTAQETKEFTNELNQIDSLLK